MRKYSPYEYVKLMALAAIKAPNFYKNPFRSQLKIKEFQFKAIKKLIIHAYLNTDLYNRKYKEAGVTPDDFQKLEDLSKFPTVTKDEIITSFPDKLLIKKINLEKCIVSVSSGSSGKVIRIYHRPEDTWAYMLGRFRILNINNNYSVFDKTLYIYTSEYPARSFFGLYPAFFIPTLNDLADTAQKIKSIQPQIICSYPSLMIELMKFLTTKEAQDLKLKLISLGSELSSKKQRQTLKEYFNCPVYDEYSSEELGWIANECPKENYHISEDISYIETVEGEIVGTNLHNYAMPFIRYQQGDTGKIADALVCPCGRKFRVLESFIGRKNDEFIFKDGTKLTSAYLLDVIYSLLLDMRLDITDFCLIQETGSKIKLEILAETNFSEEDLQSINQRLVVLFPRSVIIETAQVNKLYKTISGKRNPIISRVNQP